MKNNELTAVKAEMSLPDGLPQEVLEKFIALQANCDALAAENVALKDYFSNHAKAVGHWNSWADEEDKIPHSPATPATDAAIAEIGAKAVDEFVSELAGKIRLAGGEDGYSLVNYGEYADHLESKGEEFAANLRAGRKG